MEDSKTANSVDVTVIVPVYNARPYITDSLTCLMNQSLRNYEVLLIDDGSTDGSSELLLDLVGGDSRFKVIHQENSGAGAARNHGLALASGSYLLFLDADDLFEANMLERMYQAAEESDADVCVCSYDVFHSSSGYSRGKQGALVQKRQRCESKTLETKQVVSSLYQRFTSSPWDKMFRADYIKRIGVQFQNIPCSNDTFFIYAALASSKSICVIDEVLIHYRIGQNGSIRSNLAEYASYDLVALDGVWMYLKNEGASSELLSSLKAEAVTQFITTLFFLIDQTGSSGCSFWNDFFSNYAKKWELNDYSYRKMISKNSRWQYSAIEKLSFEQVALTRTRFCSSKIGRPESKITRFCFTVWLQLAAARTNIFPHRRRCDY